MENKCSLISNLTDIFSYNLDGTSCVVLFDDFVNFVNNEISIKNINDSEYFYWTALIGLGFIIGVLLNILIFKVFLNIYLRKINFNLQNHKNKLQNTVLNDGEILIDKYVKGWKRENGELDIYQDLLRPKLIP